MENIWSRISGGVMFAAGDDEPLVIVLRYSPPFRVYVADPTSESPEEIELASAIERRGCETGFRLFPDCRSACRTFIADKCFREPSS